MEYLVMECGLSYAVVLDSKGRFLKVPNLGYEVGQVLDSVIVQDVPLRHRRRRMHFARWAAMAACLCLLLLGGWGFWQSPVGTVRMQINPDVQMQVNRFDRVIGLEGLNGDGKALIEAYPAYGKDIGTVSDGLADRAMEMGFLRDGGQIALTVESDRENWRTATEEMLLLELDVHLEHRVTIVAVPANAPAPPDNPPETIVIEPDQLLPEQTEKDDDRYEDTVPDDDGEEDPDDGPDDAPDDKDEDDRDDKDDDDAPDDEDIPDDDDEDEDVPDDDEDDDQEDDDQDDDDPDDDDD